MNKNSLESIILDEYVNHVLEKKQFPLSEEQEKLLEDVISLLDEKVWSDKEKSDLKAQGYDPEDLAAAEAEMDAEIPELPLDDEEQEDAKEVQRDTAYWLKRKGVVGTAAMAVAKPINKLLKFGFGTGLFQHPDDAELMMKRVRQGDDPQAIATAAYDSLFRMKQKVPDPRAAAQKQHQGGGEPEEGGGIGKDVPVSIFKRQKERPELRGKTGAVEKPLVAYLQKDLKLGPKAAQQIAKGVAGHFKGKKVPIAEGLIAEAVKKVLLTEITLTSFKAALRRGFTKALKKADPNPQQQKNAANKYLMRMRTYTKRGDLSKVIPSFVRLSDEDKQTVLKYASSYIDKQMDNVTPTRLAAIRQSADVAGTAKRQRKKDIEAKGTEKYTTSGKGKDKVEGSAIGRIMFKYAARHGAKDTEFTSVFGDPLEKQDPNVKDKQNAMVRKVAKLMRRQLRRRGYSDEEISQNLSEKLDLVIEEIGRRLLAEAVVATLRKKGTIK